MHQRGFSHRDIKPENVLLDTDKNPVLIDFGLSTKTQPGQMVKSACGTPGFMAPELSTSRPLLPMPTDLWATGCLLVELFGGNDSVKPLNDISPSNAEEKVNALFDEKLTPNKHIPEDALDVIDKLICIDPKKVSAAAVLVEFVVGLSGGFLVRPAVRVVMYEHRLLSLTSPSTLSPAARCAKDKRAPVCGPLHQGGRRCRQQRLAQTEHAADELIHAQQPPRLARPFKPRRGRDQPVAHDTGQLELDPQLAHADHPLQHEKPKELELQPARRWDFPPTLHI